MELVQQKVAEWAEDVKTLGRYAMRYLQVAYSGLTMSIQLDWQYLQWDVPGIGDFIGSMYEDLVGYLFLTLLENNEVVIFLRKLLALISKHARLRVPNPTTTLDKCHKALLGCSKRLVELLLTGDLLSYVGHSVLVQKVSAEVRKNWFERKERMLAT